MTNFIDSPLGVVCLVVLLVTSLINVYAHFIEDGLIGRLMYMSVAFTCLCGLIRYGSNVFKYGLDYFYFPDAVTPVLIALFSGLAIRNVFVRITRFIKFRRAIRVQKHF